MSDKITMETITGLLAVIPTPWGRLVLKRDACSWMSERYRLVPTFSFWGLRMTWRVKRYFPDG
jgi:hypothetical protein